MLHSTRGIVFHTIPYSDSRIIARIFTEKFGLRSYIVSSSRSKTGKVRSRLLQPLTHLDLVVQQREKNTLHTLKELSCHEPYRHLHEDIVKTSLALFVAEVLHKAVKEEEPDQPLYDFICSSLQVLDVMHDGTANFHLAFLMQLTRYLGFYPQSNEAGPQSFFDLRDGVFRPAIPNHPLFADVAESRMLELLRDISFADLGGLKLNAEQRRQIVVCMLRYYELHVSNMQGIHSHEVLSVVLG
ncbi:MAG: DNA repair protein RecO [Bacteroidia bacterium]|jgi:DNA repair protein RecO (recombination protein O)|nr:DNA repair protein RecO [Bacteroidia bacterium]